MAQQFHSIVVDIAKLRDYCLSEVHLRGRHKARVFRSKLGLTSADAQLLRRALLDAASDPSAEFIAGEADEYGRRYVLDFRMVTGAGTATLRSTWIVLTRENVLRLTSCYVL